MLYFAYGSNLNHAQMSKRCPDAKFISRASLAGYELIFDGYSSEWGGAVANVALQKYSKVLGALYEVSDEDIMKLDEYENLGRDYDKLEVVVQTKDGERTAFLYLRQPQSVSEPSQAYLAAINTGLGDCGYSEVIKISD